MISTPSSAPAAAGTQLVDTDPSTGLGTKAGFGAAVLSLVLALLDAIVGNKVDADTKLFFATGIASVLVTVAGRMYQAAKAKAALILAQAGVGVGA